MQELSKFKLKAVVIPNGLNRYMSFSVNSKSNLIDSSLFLSSPLDSLIKNLSKNHFKNLSRGFHNKVIS